MGNIDRSKTYFLLVLAAASWGFQPTCIKWLVGEWSPVTITFVRYVFLSMILLGMAWWQEGARMLPKGRSWWYLLGMGLSGVMLNNILQFTGLLTTTVTNCTLISATTPAVTAILAVVFIRERLNLIAWGGILLSFCGVLLIVSHGSLEVIRQIDFNVGDIYCFLSQIVWAIYSLLGLRVMHEMSPVAVTGWGGLLGGITTGIYGLAAQDLSISMLSMPAALSFVYAVVIGGVMAMVCWNLGVKHAGPSITSIFLNIMPIVGMMAGHFFFADEIGLIQLGGAAAICGGVYMTTHSTPAAS